jgi:hypothetical protein
LHHPAAWRLQQARNKGAGGGKAGIITPYSSTSQVVDTSARMLINHDNHLKKGPGVFGNHLKKGTPFHHVGGQPPRRPKPLIKRQGATEPVEVVRSQRIMPTTQQTTWQ